MSRAARMYSLVVAFMIFDLSLSWEMPENSSFLAKQQSD